MSKTRLGKTKPQQIAPKMREMQRILCLGIDDKKEPAMCKVILISELARVGFSKISIESAGQLMSIGERADLKAIKILEEFPINLGQHRSRRAPELDLSEFDVFVCTDTFSLRWVRNHCNNPSAQFFLVDDPKGIPSLEDAEEAAYGRVARRLQIWAEKFADSYQKTMTEA